MDKNTTLFVGMNPSATYESETLERSMNSTGDLKIIHADGTRDQIEVGNKTYDLRTTAGRSDFIREQTIASDSDHAALITLLENADRATREDIAQIILVYEGAERGTTHLERLVLSGHSDGTGLWGEDEGSIPFQVFRELAAVYPNAASQIQDVMFSACNTGNKGDPAEYRNLDHNHASAMFPNAQSIWGYNGTSPTSYTGAPKHIELWERLSRENHPERVDATEAKDAHNAKHVTTWNIKDGHRDVRNRRLDGH